jgi:hypothetical protein
MVVRRTILILSRLVAHDLKRTIGNNLVCIHIGCGTGTSLNHVYRKLLMMLAGEDLLTCLRYSSKLIVCQKTELVVCHGSTKLCDSEAIDKERIVAKMKTADREILYAAKGLDSIKGLRRHLQ